MDTGSARLWDYSRCDRREIGLVDGESEVLKLVGRAEEGNRILKKFENPGEVLLSVKSKVPANGAIICVTGAGAGTYDIWIGDKRFYFPQTESMADTPEQQQRKGIRDRLFQKLMASGDVGVLPEMSGDTAIRLLPKAGQKLPEIRVHNEYQNLNLIFGPMLHVRLEQSHDQLSFQDPERATIGYNLSPFLINVPGQWKYRPGVMTPGGQTQAVRDRSLMQRTRIYRLSNKRWVGAGTYMATTTRLTTMEAANESARHAVNTILDALVERPGKEYNAQGLLLAEFADTWDPERNELDDLEPLKRLDEKLVNEDLPHVMDIFKVMEAVDALPMHGKASKDPISNLIHLLQHVAEDFDKDFGFSRETLFGLIGKAAEQFHEALDPFGLLREGFKGMPIDLVDRIQRGVRSFIDELARKSNSGSTTTS
jgi:hypothetical protein